MDDFEVGGPIEAQPIDLSIFAPKVEEAPAATAAPARRRRTYEQYQQEVGEFDGGNAVARGAARSLIGQGAGLSGAAEIVTGAVGASGAKEGLKQFGDQADKLASLIPSISFQEAASDPRLLPQYVGEAVGNVLGFMGPMLVSAPISGASKVAGAAGKLAQGLRATTPYVAATSTGDVYREIRENTGKEAPLISLGAGIAQGVLEKFGAEKMLGSILESTAAPEAKKFLLRELFTKEAVRRIAPQAAKAGAQATLGEGGTEALQEAISIAANAWVGDKFDAITPENGARLLEAFAGGVAGALPFGGASAGKKVYNSYLSNKDFAEAFAKGREQAEKAALARTSAMGASQDQAIADAQEQGAVRSRVDALGQTLRADEVAQEGARRSRLKLREGAREALARRALALPPTDAALSEAVDPSSGMSEVDIAVQAANDARRKRPSQLANEELVPLERPQGEFVPLQRPVAANEGARRIQAPGGLLDAQLEADALRTAEQSGIGSASVQTGQSGFIPEGGVTTPKSIARLAPNRLSAHLASESSAAPPAPQLSPQEAYRQGLEPILELARQARANAEAASKAKRDLEAAQAALQLGGGLGQGSPVAKQLEAGLGQPAAPSAPTRRRRVAPIPERPETIEAQLEATLDPQSTKAVTLVTPGAKAPSAIPPGLESVQTGHGRAIYNPKKVGRRSVIQAGRGPEFDGRLLGMSQSAKPANDPGAAVVRTKDERGRIVMEEAVERSPEAIARARDAGSRVAPKGRSELVSQQEVVDERGRVIRPRNILEFGGTADGPTQSVSELQKEVGTTGSLADLLRAVARRSPGYRAVFDFLASMSAGADAPTFELGRGSDEYNYSKGTNVVRLLSANSEIPERIILHEAIHALTARYVSKFIYGGAGELRGAELLQAIKAALSNPSTPEPARQLIELYLQAVDHFGLANQLFGVRSSATPSTITAQVTRDGLATWYSTTPEEEALVMDALKTMGVAPQSVGGRITAQFTPDQLTQLKAIGALRKAGMFSKSFNLVFPGVAQASAPGSAGTYGAASATLADGVQYGFSNLDEFLSEAMSNPEFQGMLNTIPSQNGGTLWTKFLEILQTIFPFLRVNSLLADVMNVTERIIQAQQALQGELGAEAQTDGQQLNAPVTTKRQLLDRIRMEARGNEEAELREFTSARVQSNEIASAFERAAAKLGTGSRWALRLSGVPQVRELMNEATAKALVNPTTGKAMSFSELVAAKNDLPPFMRDWYLETARDTFVRYRMLEEKAGEIVARANSKGQAFANRAVNLLREDATFQADWATDPKAAAETYVARKDADKRAAKYLRRYLRNEEAKSLVTEVINDPVLKADYQLANREAGASKLTPPVGRKLHSAEDFDTWSTLPKPDGTTFSLSLPTTREETVKAIESLEGYLKELNDWVIDNQDDPYVDFWNSTKERLTGLQLELMRRPGVPLTKAPFIHKWIRMAQTALAQINSPAARQAIATLGNLVAADEKAQTWNSKYEPLFAQAAREGAKSHQMEPAEWISSVWAQYSGLAQKIGGRLPVGATLFWKDGEAVKVTEADEKALKLQVEGYSSIINDKDLAKGREGVMGERYVADRYGDSGGQVVYRPAIRRSDSTLPKVFAQRGVEMVTALFGAEPDTTSMVSRFRASLGEAATDEAYLQKAKESGVAGVLENNPDFILSHFNNRGATINSGKPNFEEADYDYVAAKARSEEVDGLDEYAELLSERTQGTDKAVSVERAKRLLIEELLDVAERANKYFTENEKDLNALTGIKVKVMNLRSQNTFTLGRQEAKFPWFFWNHGYHSTVNLAQFSTDARAQYFTDFYDNLRLIYRELEATKVQLDQRIQDLAGPRPSDAQTEEAKRQAFNERSDLVKKGQAFVEWENLHDTLGEVKALIDAFDSIGSDEIKNEQRLNAGMARVLGDVVGATLSNLMTGLVNVTSVARTATLLARINNFSLSISSALAWEAVKSMTQDGARMVYGLTSAPLVGAAGFASQRGGLQKRTAAGLGAALDQMVNKVWMKDITIAGIQLGSTYKKLVEAGYAVEKPFNAIMDNYLDLAATRGRYEVRTTIKDKKWSDRLSLLTSIYNLSVGLPITILNEVIGPAIFDKIANNAAFRMGSLLPKKMEIRLKDLHRKSRGALEPFINSDAPIPPQLIIPKLFGIKHATATELQLMEQLFLSGGLSLQEEVKRFWKKLDTDKSATFLTDNQRAEMGMQLINFENRPTIANRPTKSRTSVGWRMLLPIFGWTSAALNNSLHWMTKAKGDPKTSAFQMTVHQALMMGGLALAFAGSGYWSEWLRRMVLRLYGERPMSKYPHEAETGGEAIRLLAQYALSGLPIIGSAAALALGQGTASGGIGMDIFFVRKLEDILKFGAQVIKTGDPANPKALYQLAKGFFPAIRLVGNRFESVSGSVALNNNKRLIQTYGPKDLVRDTGGSGRLNISYTPMSPLMDRMINAAGNGDFKQLQALNLQAIEMAKKLGKANPEGYVKQLYASRDPYKGALKLSLTEEQRAEMLRQMPEEYRAEFLESEQRFYQGYAAIGGTPRMSVPSVELSDSYRPAAQAPSAAGVALPIGGGVSSRPQLGAPAGSSRRVRLAQLPVGSGGYTVGSYSPRLGRVGARTSRPAVAAPRPQAVRRSRVQVRRPRISSGNVLRPRRLRL